MALAAYRDAVLTRFSNPAVNDQLLRITSDGASKIPVFLGDTIRACLDRRRRPRRLAFLLAAFARYLAGVDDRGAAFDAAGAAPDRGRPRARGRSRPDGRLAHRARSRGSGWSDRAAFVASFARYRALIAEQGALAALAGRRGQG